MRCQLGETWHAGSPPVFPYDMVSDAKRRFGMNGLRKLLIDTQRMPIDQAKAEIVAQINSIRGNAEASDDVTLILTEVA